MEGCSGETSASCFAWLSVEGRERCWGGREGEVGVKGARGVEKEIAWRLYVCK